MLSAPEDAGPLTLPAPNPHAEAVPLHPEHDHRLLAATLPPIALRGRRARNAG